MKHRFVYILLVCFVSACTSAPPNQPASNHIGRYSSNTDDKKAIERIIADFQRGLIEKDGALLQTLFLHDDILFLSAPSQTVIEQTRTEQNPVFLKQHPAGNARNFISFVETSSAALEERLYNVKITQDTSFAIVVFDYEFKIGGTIANYGIETWQMLKVDGHWRIASVMWSSTPMTR